MRSAGWPSRFPEAVVVLAHCAHPATAAGLALLDAHPSLYADLTPVGRSTLAVSDADLEAHADRLLFGSDTAQHRVLRRLPAGRPAGPRPLAGRPRLHHRRHGPPPPGRGPGLRTRWARGFVVASPARIDALTSSRRRR